MDHISLRLRSFKLHLAIPMNLHACLPKTLTLTYLPRIDETPLEINGASIPSNKMASIVLRRVRSAGVIDESGVVFTSTDCVCIGNGFGFEVYIRGKKAFKGFFRRGVRWGLECEVIGFMIWAEVSVATDGGYVMRERVKLSKTRFRPTLPTISEEDEEEEDDEEEDVKAEMRRSDDLNYIEKNKKDDGDGAVKKGVGWAVNVGIFVACLGVGLFVSRASLRRLAGLNLL